ncbi:MAG TPA: Xaa-Pro peptidase family protein, partial [Geobacteraceae bacterium]|nr:Xaa-Pro peptidase family protein [Geobacteraceae bacterium]
LEHRCSRMQQLMAEEGLDAVIVVQSADLFYFTGTIQTGCLYIPSKGQPLYLVRRDAARARMESGLREVLPFSSMSELPAVLARYGYPEPKTIGMEFDVLPVNVFERYRKVFPLAAVVDASMIIRRLRMKKSSYEIHLMQDAAVQVDKVYRSAAGHVREGITDLQLAAELERIARLEGHQGLIRMRVFNGEMLFGHTFSGSDSAVPAYTDTPLGGLGISPSFGQGASYKPIGRNEPIIIDFSGCCDGYLVDQTRVMAVGGLSSRLMKGYEDMLQIQELMKKMAPQLPSWGELYDECLSLAVSMGYGDNFMGVKGAQTSFIGHGIGVEIDEYPFIAKGFHQMRLEPGMSFAFEPKLVFPGEGAVGIENSFYLADDGSLKQLTFSDEKIIIIR